MFIMFFHKLNDVLSFYVFFSMKMQVNSCMRSCKPGQTIIGTFCCLIEWLLFERMRYSLIFILIFIVSRRESPTVLRSDLLTVPENSTKAFTRRLWDPHWEGTGIDKSIDSRSEGKLLNRRQKLNSPCGPWLNSLSAASAGSQSHHKSPNVSARLRVLHVSTLSGSHDKRRRGQLVPFIFSPSTWTSPIRHLEGLCQCTCYTDVRHMCWALMPCYTARCHWAFLSAVTASDVLSYRSCSCTRRELFWPCRVNHKIDKWIIQYIRTMINIIDFIIE